jgi:hypothetical protein
VGDWYACCGVMRAPELERAVSPGAGATVFGSYPIT